MAYIFGHANSADKSASVLLQIQQMINIFGIDQCDIS